MPPHAARAALSGLRTDRNRLAHVRPRLPNLPGQLEHPRPQLLGILDTLPRPVAADDEAMRRANPQLFLDSIRFTARVA